MPVTQEYIKQLLSMIADLQDRMASMQQSMQSTIDSLNETIRTQQELIKELQEKLNKNSKNSSKPPSSDGLKKQTKDRSLREKTGKKQGGQEGHEGVSLFSDRKPDNVIKHMPSRCTGCPHYAECLAKAKVTETRSVIDAKLETAVTAHCAMCVGCCPLDLKEHTGKFPDDIKAVVQYGDRLKALVVSLNTYGAISLNRIHEILGSVFSIPISPATIASMVSGCAKNIRSVLDRIREPLLDSCTAHCDETGIRVDKKTIWAHVFSNEDYTYLTLSRKRGKKGMDESGMLPLYHGIAIHDCWQPYWKYTDATHAVCGAHLLRELKGMEENYPEQTWHKCFADLLMKMKKLKDKAVAKGCEAVSYYHLHKFSRFYDEIIVKACEENPLPEVTEKKRGRKKKGKARALIERLRDLKEAVMLFLKDFRVDFDNNLAERDLRVIKVKTKVSGCFRTYEGAEEYLTIMSYTGTARKQRKNAYEAIYNAVIGNPEFIFR